MFVPIPFLYVKSVWVGAFEIQKLRIFLTCTIHALSTSLIQVQGYNRLFSKQRRQSQQLNMPTVLYPPIYLLYACVHTVQYMCGSCVRNDLH